MVNFMCQLDWATGCPHIWLTLFLDVSMSVFDEISIWICRLSKADGPPQCGWALSNPRKAGTEYSGWRLNALSLSVWLADVEHQFAPVLEVKFKLSMFLFSGLLARTGISTIGFPGSPVYRLQIVEFSLHKYVSQLLTMNLFLFIHVCIYMYVYIYVYVYRYVCIYNI